jgi:hypothetical protein
LGITVLKLKKTRDQKKSRPKEDIYYRVSDLKMLNEDNEEVKDQNESTGLSLLEISDQEISWAKYKNNFSASELIITSSFSEEVDKDLAILSGDKEEVKDTNESSELSLLETSDQGNSLNKDKGDLSVAELERIYGLSEEVDKEKLTNVRSNLGIIRKSNRIKNPVSAKLDDFYGQIKPLC